MEMSGTWRVEWEWTGDAGRYVTPMTLEETDYLFKVRERIAAGVNVPEAEIIIWEMTYERKIG